MFWKEKNKDPGGKSHKNRKLIHVISAVVISLFVIYVGVYAGNLTPSANPASTMYTLTQLYNSIAGTFDSSAITASSTGSIIEQLKYIANNLFWASSSGNIYLNPTSSISVGLGTHQPSSTLHVSGTVRTTAPTTLAVLGGNVGVGTLHPSTTFHVVGVATLQGLTFITATSTGNLTISTISSTNITSTGISATSVSTTQLSASVYLQTAGLIFTNGTGTTITITQVSSTNITASEYLNIAGLAYFFSDVSFATTAAMTASTPASGTSALLRLGPNLIQGGNAVYGTYLGINGSSSWNGDFVNFQQNSSSQFTVSATGTIFIAGNLSVAQQLSSTGISSTNISAAYVSSSIISSTIVNTANLTFTTATSTGNLTVSTISSTNITSTGISATSVSTTQLSASVYLQTAGLIFTNGTGTTITITQVSSTNISSTNATFGAMAVTNASATNLTASGYLQAASVVITGTAISSGITFTNATGTGNLEIATFRVTGSSTLATAGGTAGVGIGTTTVGNLFTIATATPIFVVSGTTGRIGIGTSSPVDDFEVARRTASFNSGLDATIGVFSANGNTLPSPLQQEGVAAANGYVYVLGGHDGSNTTSTVLYAKINADGSLGAFTRNAVALPEVRRLGASVVANGYIYFIAGLDASANDASIYYAKLNSDGSTGSFVTNPNSLPAAIRQFSAVMANGYVYVLGGYDGSAFVSAVYYAKLNADGSIGPFTTNANSLPVTRMNFGSVIANGYVYVVGGENTTATSSVLYAKINADGSLGVFTTNSNALPWIKRLHTSFTANGYLYALGGASSTATSSIYYGKLNNDGSINAFVTDNTTMDPAMYAHASVFVNGYFYRIGGNNGSVTSSVFYASTALIRMAGTLDLLGLTNQALTDSAGDGGSSIYAGNIYSANSLEVSGLSQFWNGVGITGLLSVKGSTGTDPTTIFNVFGGTAIQATTTAAATSSLLTLGNWSIQGGNSASGTYIGINPRSFGGDFLNFQTNSSSQFRVSATGTAVFAGNILIGTTTAYDLFTIAGTSTYFTVSSTGVTTFSRLLRVGDNATSGRMQISISSSETIQTNTSGHDMLYITNTNPTTGTLAAIIFSDSPVTATDGAAFVTGIFTKFQGHVNNYGDLIFGTRGTDGWNNRMIITATGSIGIGTSTPNAPLHVFRDTNNAYARVRIQNVNAGGGGGGEGAVVTIQNSTTTAEFVLHATGHIGSRMGFSLVNTTEIYGVGADRFNIMTINSAPIHFGVGNPSTPNFAIASSGRIGIGTTTPGYGLVVGNGVTQKDVLVANGFLCVDSNTSGCPNAEDASSSGKIFASSTSITAIDLAENYVVVDNTIEAGDMVSVGYDKSRDTENNEKFYVEKSNKPYDEKLVGVISTAPGVLLGRKIKNSRPVALSGRVPVKVSLENGPIHSGDYLTAASGTPGYAMKATKPGRVVPE